MKKATFQISYEHYEQIESLSASDQELFRLALEAQEKAYAPYSSYRVGAAVRLANGKVVTGNNQENAAYPSGLCAERVALFAAKSQDPDTHVQTLLVVTNAGDLPDPASPCGSCRQVMVEYEGLQNTPMRVILADTKGRSLHIHRAADLLPFCFTCEQLKYNS